MDCDISDPPAYDSIRKDEQCSNNIWVSLVILLICIILICSGVYLFVNYILLNRDINKIDFK